MTHLYLTVIFTGVAIGCYLWRKKVLSLGGHGLISALFSLISAFTAIICGVYMINDSLMEDEAAARKKKEPFTKHKYEGHTYILYSTSFMHDPDCVCRKRLTPRVIEEPEADAEGKEENDGQNKKEG